MAAPNPFQDLDREGLIALAPAFAEALHRAGSIGGLLVAPDVLKAFQAHGVSLSMNNYYSTIPDVAKLPDSLWDGPTLSPAWARVNVADYLPLLRTCVGFARELEDIPRVAASGFHWDNPMYPPLDAITYYGIVRSRQPRRVLEVGSGFSTQVAARALKANGQGVIECVEPYPSDELLALGVKVRREGVQDTPDDLFAGLGAGDILFIDTGHVVKIGSDVNTVLFRVLPLLKRGVLVHIHDMMLPYEYPRSWYHDIGIIWNEQYAVLALLMDNPRLRVVLPNYLASQVHQVELEAALKSFDIWQVTQNMGGAKGAGLWLEVLAD